jgi:hypothetical protein
VLSASARGALAGGQQGGKEGGKEGDAEDEKGGSAMKPTIQTMQMLQKDAKKPT